MLDNHLPKAIIFDLDGTLCDVDHRVHHVQKEEKDWVAFNQGLIHDDLNHWCYELIEAMKSRGYKIIFITGRADDYQDLTEQWFKKHNVSYDLLYMRDRKDRREDSDVKESIYREHIEGKYQVLFVVDDRKSVVERWRKLKLICLQCEWGDF